MFANNFTIQPPPDFLSSPFKYQYVKKWGIDKYYNFKFIQAYFTSSDWERIIIGKSEDNLSRAESMDDLWLKWKHVFSTFDQRNNFVYSFYLEPNNNKTLSESKIKREKIPAEVRNSVWNRDNGKCVECGSNEKIEFDHIIPISKGGSSTYRNLQILCESCNRKKHNKI